MHRRARGLGDLPACPEEDAMTAEECDAEAARCVARGDALGAVIWRARAACTRNGKVLHDRRGWAERWEESDDAARKRNVT